MTAYLLNLGTTFWHRDDLLVGHFGQLVGDISTQNLFENIFADEVDHADVDDGRVFGQKFGQTCQDGRTFDQVCIHLAVGKCRNFYLR